MESEGGMSDFGFHTGQKSDHHNRDNRGMYKQRALLTARGALQRFQPQRVMFSCPICSQMASPVKVDNHIVEGPNSVTYLVALFCGCPARVVTVQQKKIES